MKICILFLINIYRLFLSPVLILLPGFLGCRFYPSCSAYSADAIQKYGVAKGAWRAAARVARCNPFNRGGYDPA